MAKTNWQYNDIVTEADLNQLGQEINEKETIAGSQARAAEAVTIAKAYTDQQITLVTETGIPKLNVYEYQMDGEAGAAEFEIPLETFDANTDTVKLYINTTVKDRSDFTVENAIYDNGTLISRGKVVLNQPLSVDSRVVIEVWKNIPIGEEGSVSGQVIAPNSMPQNRVIGLEEALNSPKYASPAKTVGPVIPLSNSEYGKLKYKLYGRTYVNLVENGNFKNGTDGWSVALGTIAASSNTLTITGNGTGTNPYAYMALKLIAVTRKKVFARAKLKVTNNECNSIDIRILGSTSGSATKIISSVNNPLQNQEYVLYGVVNLDSSISGNISFRCVHSYLDATAASGKIMEVKEIMCLDLDQYPWLNGLTAEEINEQIPYYIDGLQSVSNLKMVSVGKNLFYEPKVNSEFASTGQSGTRATVNYDGEKIRITGIANNYSSIRSKDFKLRKNTDYKIVVDGYRVGNASARVQLWGVKNGVKTVLSEFTQLNTTRSVVISEPVNSGDYDSWHIQYYPTNNITSDIDMIVYSTMLIEADKDTTYEPYQESVVFLDKPLRSLPNGVADEIDSDGNLIRRVGEVVVESEDIVVLYTSYTNVDIVRLDIIPDVVRYGVNDLIATKAITSRTIPLNGHTTDSPDAVWKHRFSTTQFQIVVPKGTYANLAEAQAALAGTVVQYELASPIVENVHIPPLSSFKEGTLSFQNRRKYILQADDIASMFTGYTNVDLALITIPVTFPDCQHITGYDTNYVFSVNGREATYAADNISEIGKYFTSPVASIPRLIFVVPKGTTLQQAQEQLAGLEIEYETIPFLLTKVEYAYPINLPAGVKGNTEAIAQLGRELGDLWENLLSIADKELAMGLITPLTTTETTDLKNKVNEILQIWR